MPDGPAFDATTRTALRRHRERGEFDRKAVYAILDEGLICHAACSVDGTTWVLPTAYGRRDDSLYLHGAAGNHLLKAACAGAELTISVTLVDGLVMSKSMMNHSMNFRSVVLFGLATEIAEPEAKHDALAVIVNHMMPGRVADTRPPTASELLKTRVVSVPIREVSAKVRTGPPVDYPEDEGLPIWAGVVPLSVAAGPVETADTVRPEAGAGAPVPPYIVQPQRWRSS